MTNDELTTLEWIRSLLPLEIAGVDVADPTVAFSGNGWGLSVVCPWFLESHGVDWESDEAAIIDAFDGFVGQRITAVTALDDEATDPVFAFSRGARLRVVADSDLDPWVLVLPGITVVGRRSRG